MHVRRHHQAIDIQLVIALAPPDCPHQATIGKRRQPAQRGGAERFNVFVQGWYPVVIDQSRLDCIGRMLELEQGARQLEVGAGNHLQDAYRPSITARA